MARQQGKGARSEEEKKQVAFESAPRFRVKCKNIKFVLCDRCLVKMNDTEIQYVGNRLP